MNDTHKIVVSPRLDNCPPSLPASAYYDPEQFRLETERVFSRNWTYVGRTNDLQSGQLKRVTVASQNLFLVKSDQGAVRAFYNTCRHRGSELCAGETQQMRGKLITCPYHAWSYAADGRLVSTGFARPTKDFRREDHGLIPVALKDWNGLLFICLAADPPDFDIVPDIGPHALDNWPMRDLVTGHREVIDKAFNWKVFWENYSECLHCPGIHPMLSDMVPIYAKGVMAANEAQDWRPDQGLPARNLKEGATSWTMNGEPCGPEFPNLTVEERAAGYVFVTFWPTAYVVAHPDYVRIVTVTPLGPETTRLTAEWLFPAATLAQPGFRRANVVEFAMIVMKEDADACEMNQRGLKAPGFQGRLMPEEYEIRRFHLWLEAQLAEDRR